MKRTALYTTVYANVLRFLPDWHRSLLTQIDCDFDLWVGLDGLRPEDIARTLGTELNATWVSAEPADTPVSLRSKALEEICERYDSVVLVDSDDVLDTSRTKSARKGLEGADVYACALDIIDESGRELGLEFGPPEGWDLDVALARVNVFGLSNSAWRCKTLVRCLPAPRDCTLMDWYLATYAWGLGARFVFDPVCRMRYRQYDANVARVVPPFSERQVAEAAELVVGHYKVVLKSAAPFPPEKRRLLEAAFKRTEEFRLVMSTSPQVLARYVDALNRLPPQFIWWVCVAHPELDAVWKT